MWVKILKIKEVKEISSKLKRKEWEVSGIVQCKNGERILDIETEESTVKIMEVRDAI